jgi:hypothetical protein
MSHKPYFKFQGGRYVLSVVSLVLTVHYTNCTRLLITILIDFISRLFKQPPIVSTSLSSTALTPGYSNRPPYLYHDIPPSTLLPLTHPIKTTILDPNAPSTPLSHLTPMSHSTPNRYYGIAIVNSQGKKLKMPRGAVTVTYQIHRSTSLCDYYFLCSQSFLHTSVIVLSLPCLPLLSHFLLTIPSSLPSSVPLLSTLLLSAGRVSPRPSPTPLSARRGATIFSIFPH